MSHCFKPNGSSSALSLFPEKFKVMGGFLLNIISLLTFRLLDLCHAKKALGPPTS